MDALAQLALMTKAKLVFEKPGSFLSFPVLSPISYKASDLNFDQNPQVPILSDFSGHVNSRFNGPLYQPDTDDHLWDTYQYVLDNAALAREKPGSEDVNFIEAMQLLTAKDENGMLEDSPQMTTYKQYRDAWITTTQDYKTQQLTAELSTDPAVKNQWARIDEPRLRAIQQQTEDEWVQKGFRNEIDRAVQIQKAHAAQSPLSSWRDWDTAFEPTVDLQTATGNQPFALTSYSPQGIVDQDWLTFHLTRNEINQLAGQAPPELRNILALEGSTSTVESLSFEYRSAALSRYWFRPALFDARFWKLPEGDDEISDGGNPARGVWPAYAVAVVFVRNITVTMRGRVPVPQGPALARLFTPRLRIPPPVKPARPRLSIKTKTKARIPAPTLTATTVGRVDSRRAPRPKLTIPRQRATPGAVIADRLGKNSFRPIKVKPPPLPPPPPPPPNTTTMQGTREEVSILAFICKWFPKSPNPDPALEW